MIDLLFEGEQAHQIKTIGNRHPTYTLYNTQANVFLNPFLLLELFFMQVSSTFTNSQIPRTILRTIVLGQKQSYKSSELLYTQDQSLARSSLTSHQNYSTHCNTVLYQSLARSSLTSPQNCTVLYQSLASSSLVLVPTVHCTVYIGSTAYTVPKVR